MLSLGKKRGTARGRSKMGSLLQKNSITCQLMISTTTLKTRLIRIPIRMESIMVEGLNQGLTTRELLAKLKRRTPRI
jgi:hypothetical protein